MCCRKIILWLNGNVPLVALREEPFIPLEKEANNDISEIFRQSQLTPKVRYTLWDDYAIMSMVESGLGVSILPGLILKHIPYRVETRELDVPACRNISLALKDKKTASVAVRRFMDYLKYR